MEEIYQNRKIIRASEKNEHEIKQYATDSIIYCSYKPINSCSIHHYDRCRLFDE